MLQNVKVDIIYYLTNTDFEMEFNLCGCCRMRLLTDKATDRKSFINMLSRAVSRSRIIIACGGLFSETGLIETVAHAIGKPLETADNEAYGISGNSEIKIISGSTPLVTPEGYFGGCIIESGPQTIILLSESRNVRKSIMQTLIHPYIEEFSMMPMPDSAVRGAHEAEAPVAPVIPEAPIADKLQEPQESAEEEAEEISAETEESAENEPAEIEEATEPQEDEASETETAAEAPDEGIVADDDETVGFVFGDDSETETDIPDFLPTEETDIPMHLVPERVKYSKKNYYDIEYKTSESDEMFISQGDGDSPKNRSSLNVWIVIISVFLVLLLLILAYFLVIVPISGGYTWQQYFRTIFGVTVSITRFI